MTKIKIFLILISVSVLLIIIGVVLLKSNNNRCNTTKQIAQNQIPVEIGKELEVEKEEWRIVFTSLDKLMKREGVKQKGFFDLKVLSLLESADKKNLTISYVSSTGDKKTMELSREKKGEYYKGWFENTHPDKKRGSIKIYLLEDTMSVYETTDIVTGKKNKNFPAFLGNVEDEMTVKIFKRVSSG